MTDAREKLALVIGRAWLGADYQAGDDRASFFKEAVAILSALNLTPSAASALMDGTATVVPSDLTDEQCEALAAQMDVEWRKQTVHENYPSVRAQHRAAIAASPYRATTLIDDLPDDEFTRDASAENVTAGK